MYIVILELHNIAWPSRHSKKMHVLKVPQEKIVHINFVSYKQVMDVYYNAGLHACSIIV